MKPRLRLVIDNTRPGDRRRRPPAPPAPAAPRWTRAQQEEIIDRALCRLRDLKMPLTEKERLLRLQLD